MTAREDQPKCRCHFSDDRGCHIHPEDQPRPTPPYKIGEGQFGTVSSGMLRYLDMQKEASEAQGEAPQRAHDSSTCKDQHCSLCPDRYDVLLQLVYTLLRTDGNSQLYDARTYYETRKKLERLVEDELHV